MGGVICFLGQCLLMTGTGPLMLSREDAAAFTSIVLVFLASLLTGIGVYDRIGKYAGGGSIVPITGFRELDRRKRDGVSPRGAGDGRGRAAFPDCRAQCLFMVSARRSSSALIAWLVEVL